MATFTLRRITDMVGLQLGEFPDCRLSASPATAATDLSSMIRVILEEEARRITREAPLSQFTDVHDFSKHLLRETDFGETAYAEAPLPADFCRLQSLRLPGWSVTLSEESPGDPLRLSLGENAPDWLASRPTRPWLYIFNRDGSPTIRFGPPDIKGSIIAGYIPLPHYDTDDEWLTNFEPALMPLLIATLTKALTPT